MTPQQINVLDHVREVIATTGSSPSVREIAAQLHLGISGAHRVIDALVDVGALQRTGERTRNLRLPDQPDLRSASTDALIAELRRRGEETYQRRQFAAPATARTCAVDGCYVALRDGLLMCRRHWFMLPTDLQNGLRRTSARGETARFDSLLASAKAIARNDPMLPARKTCTSFAKAPQR